MKKSLFSISFLILISVGVSCAQENNPAYYTHNGLVVDGYDLVTYFNNEEPKKGIKQYRASFEGQIFLFASDENKEEFKKNPEKYIPKYGGWCAYAMAIDGSKVKIDPTTFKIIDDELYFFYNFNFTNTLNKWNENESELKKKADSFWTEQ